MGHVAVGGAWLNFHTMANEPDPPDAPKEWRVYEGDPTPDPEPEATTTPPADPPKVPYGQAQTSNPVFVTRSTGGTPKLALVIIGVAVLGGAVAAAAGIFAAVGGPDGIGGIGGIDAKDPEAFAEMVETLEEERDTTEVTWVGLYSSYIIIDMPYSRDPGDDREISWTWRGGDDLEEGSKSTSTDARFDLSEIDPDVIEGMCDPVLAEAEGATEDDCYVFISAPSEDSETWFRVSASDDFGRSYNIEYDKDGVEVSRTFP